MSRLSELFALDPFKWTAADVEEAIAYYRQRRDNPHLFKKDGSPRAERKPAIGSRPGKPRKPKPKVRRIPHEADSAAGRITGQRR